MADVLHDLGQDADQVDDQDQAQRQHEGEQDAGEGDARLT